MKGKEEKKKRGNELFWFKENSNLTVVKEMESNEIVPFKIPPKFFKDLKPFSINLGSKHVVVLV